MKLLVIFTIILTALQCVANGNSAQPVKPVTQSKEMNVRDRKIKILQEELADIQDRMLTMFKCAESNDLKLPDLLRIIKSVNISSEERPKDMPVNVWISKQNKIIEDLGKEVKSRQTQMLLLMHYISSKGIELPEDTYIFIPQPPPYINPEFQDDYSIGAIADVDEIKIFQKQKDNRALVEVQYKAPIRQVLSAPLKIGSRSIPTGDYAPYNRNTAKTLRWYGGTSHSDGTFKPAQGNRI